MWSKFYCAYHPVQPSGSCGLVTDGPSALKHHSVQRPYFAGASPPAHFRSLCSNDFAVLFTDTVPTRSVNKPDTSRSQLLLEQHCNHQPRVCLASSPLLGCRSDPDSCRYCLVIAQCCTTQSSKLGCTVHNTSKMNGTRTSIPVVAH